MYAIDLLINTGENGVIDDAAFAEEICLQCDRVNIARDAGHRERHPLRVSRIEREVLEGNCGECHLIERRKKSARRDMSGK